MKMYCTCTQIQMYLYLPGDSNLILFQVIVEWIVTLLYMYYLK